MPLTKLLTHPFFIKLKKFPFLVCLLITALQFFFVLLFFPICYTNDDIGPMFLAKGVVLSNEPTPLIFFQHFIYGYYLVFMGKILSGINFYTWNNIILLFLAFANIYYHIRLYFGYKKLLLFAALTSIFTLSFFSYLQFTILASLLYISSLCSLISFLHYNKKENIYVFIVFFFIASLVRFDQIIVLTLFLTPAIIFWWIKAKRSVKINSILILYITFMVGFGLKYLNNWYYEANNFPFYGINDKESSLFYDYNIYGKQNPLNRTLLKEALGLTDNDIKLQYCFFETPDIIKKVNQVDKSLIQSYQAQIPLLDFFTIENFIFYLKNNYFIYSIAVYLFLIFLFHQKKAIFIPLLLFSWYIILALLFSCYIKELPFRVNGPIFFAYQCITFIFFARSLQQPKLKYKIVGVLFFYSYCYYLYLIREDFVKNEPDTTELTNLLKNRPDSFITPLALNHCLISPFDNLNEYKTGHLLYPTNHHTILSPNTPKHIRENFDNELLKAKFIYDDEWSFEVYNIQKYFLEHYGYNTIIKFDGWIPGTTLLSCRFEKV